MTPTTSREIRLKRRPQGLPATEDFELAAVELPPVGDGELRVRNRFMSVDPYMRGRMINRKSYLPPFQLGRALEGGAVGQVEESRNARFNSGDWVLSFLGWREAFVCDGAGLMPIDVARVAPQAHLGVLGMTGLTAYVGLLDIGAPQEGETVWVSAAAGAVGSVVCQIARIKGCRVVASAGSDAKVAWLREAAKVDAAFNYKKAPDLAGELQQHCPKGVDVYFEGVGGNHLQAALESMNVNGRVVMCGMISEYNAATPPPGPSNLSYVIGKRLRLQGFIVSDHLDRLAAFSEDMIAWIADGRLVWKETVSEGLASAPAAFTGLFTGENFGKMIVKL